MHAYHIASNAVGSSTQPWEHAKAFGGVLVWACQCFFFRGGGVIFLISAWEQAVSQLLGSTLVSGPS